MKKNKGLGLLDIVLAGMAVAFVAFLLAKIGFPFYENHALKRIVSENAKLVLADNGDKRELADRIKKGLAIENIKTIPTDDAVITVSDGSVKYELDYSVENPLYGENVFVKVYFSVNEEVR